MTKEEAIKDIKFKIAKAKALEASYVDCIEASALEIALEALEKQIPKKPELVPIKENRKHTWKCPTCGSYEVSKFCQCCGQKIDWEW